MGKTLRARLIFFMIMLAAIIALSLTVGSYLQMRNQMVGQALNTEISGTVDDSIRLIQSWISIRTSITSAGADNLASGGEISPALVQTAKSGLFQAAYIGMADHRMLTDHEMSLPSGYDPTKRPWYQDNVNASGTVMTPPYVDMSTHKLVISFVAPVHKNGVFLGVFGTDVLLDDIVKSILSVNLPGDGYALLIGKDGTVLVHKDADRVTKPASDISGEFAPMALADLTSRGQLKEAVIDGVEKYVYAKEVAGTGLVLAVVVDKATALAPLSGLLWRAVITFFVLMAVILPLAGLQISHMLSGLRKIYDAMEDIAQGEGDLTRKIDISGQDEIARTAQAFNRFMDTLHKMFLEVRSEAERLTSGVEKIATLLGNVADDSKQLSELTSENAASVEEITVSISHIADHSSDADTLVKDTGALSCDSEKIVKEVAEEVERSAQEVGGLATLLDSLSERSQEISGIIRVIKDIADQTNLLALNAAIEAARAGEQGRGFAVVADEVRKLAERTAQATVQITGMIEGIHKEMGVAVIDMQSTLKTVQGGAGASEHTAEKIGRIRENMDAVMSRMNEIALSTREQLAATTSMAQSAEKITNQMQSSDVTLQHASAEVRKLNELAEGLQKTFRQFKL
jgi:methyl-accepting chemotaxis protein